MGEFAPAKPIEIETRLAQPLLVKHFGKLGRAQASEIAEKIAKASIEDNKRVLDLMRRATVPRSGHRAGSCWHTRSVV